MGEGTGRELFSMWKETVGESHILTLLLCTFHLQPQHRGTGQAIQGGGFHSF